MARKHHQEVAVVAAQEPPTLWQRPRLARLALAVGTVKHPHQPVRYNLPAGWQPISPEDRQEASTLLSTLTTALDPTASFLLDGDVYDGQMAKAALLTKMIRGLGGKADPSDIEASSKVSMYADSINVLPAWAIDLAIKRWGRGACPSSIEEKPNYNFPPSPAALRAMAFLELETPRRQHDLLTRLLAATSVDDAMDPDKVPHSTAVVPASLRRM